MHKAQPRGLGRLGPILVRGKSDDPGGQPIGSGWSPYQGWAYDRLKRAGLNRVGAAMADLGWKR